MRASLQLVVLAFALGEGGGPCSVLGGMFCVRKVAAHSVQRLACGRVQAGAARAARKQPETARRQAAWHKTPTNKQSRRSDGAEAQRGRVTPTCRRTAAARRAPGLRLRERSCHTTGGRRPMDALALSGTRSLTQMHALPTCPPFAAAAGAAAQGLPPGVVPIPTTPAPGAAAPRANPTITVPPSKGAPAAAAPSLLPGGAGSLPTAPVAAPAAAAGSPGALPTAMPSAAVSVTPGALPTSKADPKKAAPAAVPVPAPVAAASKGDAKAKGDPKANGAAPATSAVSVLPAGPAVPAGPTLPTGALPGAAAAPGLTLPGGECGVTLLKRVRHHS
jgi:hypothetical protein